MQCGEVMYHSFPTMTKGSNGTRPEKETIHSGHFMVSHFEDEAQDDEVDLAVPLPEAVDPDTKVTVFGSVVSGGFSDVKTVTVAHKEDQTQQQISIDNSLDKLFQCMTLAYRQKLTSPKWNRFKGIKLLWKDKIRLNNVIWRCWHMQFILKQNTLVCQFASPLDVDTHIKPETTILEGKYWKRRAEAVTAEYKKWRMFYKNRALGWGIKDVTDVISDMEVLDWQSQGDSSHMLNDVDYIDFMSDTLFSTITSNQPFAFPDTREIARGASLADFIQPSLGPLQPNLEDFMDTLEPLQDLLSGSKLAPVPEEIPDDNSVYKNSIPPSFMDQSIQNINQQSVNYSNPQQMQTAHLNQQQHQLSAEMRPEAANNMILKQGTLTNDLTLNQNTCLDSNQHNTNMLVRQNHSYIPHSVGQMLNQSNTTNPMLQQQSMMMQQQQGFNIAPRNILNQSQNINTSPMLQQAQQNVPMMTNDQQQQQMQKSQAQFMQQNHKPYNRMPMGIYQDRNYNIRQGQHQQAQNENNVYMNRVRTNSAGAIGYPTERRSRPIAPAPSQNFVQFMGAPQNLVDTKPSYAEQNHQMNIKGHIYVGTHVDQNMSGNLSIANNMRFKIPSPPPQVPATSQMRGQPMSQHKKKQSKMENFRSNSLPLGVSLASVMGITSTASSTTVVESVTPSKSNRGRRPRSGSSSPSSQQRRGPAPLVATASEPLLKDTSVLLAHLLNSKGQSYFKGNNITAIPKELTQASGSQPHPVAIIKSSLVSQMPSTIVTTTSKLVPFGSNSPTSQPSPSSPLSPGSCEGRNCGSAGGDHRRVGHIHAEQKRRYNIKNGFDLLQSLIPQFSQNPKSKVSKAAMLQKGAEYIKQLQAERNLMKEDIDNLKQQIESLINALSNCQSLLPATGVNVSRQRSGRLKEMFDDYVRERTQENWKFWIFSLLVEPLLHSYNNSVSPSSTEELKRSTYLWAEQHCSLVEMRPAALSAMRTLSTNTEILSDPSKLPEEAKAAVETKRRNSLTNQIKK